jgi:hypothetical protein
MKKNWNKEKDKFNKKLNNIFFVIHLKNIYIYIEIEIRKMTNLMRNKIIYFMKKNWNKEEEEESIFIFQF